MRTSTRKTGTRIAFVGAVGAALVLTMAGTATAKEVSAKRYARTLCKTYSGVRQSITDFTDTYNAETSDDPVAFQTEVATLASGLLDGIRQLKTDLRKLSPDVDDGKRITKLFVKNLNEISGEISSALKKFQAADPNGVAFQADITTFEVAINLLDTKTSDPFSKLTDQDVLGALDDEKSCDEVVTIFGA